MDVWEGASGNGREHVHLIGLTHGEARISAACVSAYHGREQAQRMASQPHRYDERHERDNFLSQLSSGFCRFTSRQRKMFRS